MHLRQTQTLIGCHRHHEITVGTEGLGKMEERFHVAGMSCGHCTRSVTQAVQAVDPGAQVAVDLKSKMVVVNGAVERSRMEAAIVDAGYEISAATS